MTVVCRRRSEETGHSIQVVAWRSVQTLGVSGRPAGAPPPRRRRRQRRGRRRRRRRINNTRLTQTSITPQTVRGRSQKLVSRMYKHFAQINKTFVHQELDIQQVKATVLNCYYNFTVIRLFEIYSLKCKRN